MSSFSQLIASISNPQGPQTTSSNNQRPTQPARTTSGLAANNAAAGVKRRSEEPDGASRPKSAKTEQTSAPAKPTAPSGRFQLSAKGSSSQKPAALPNRPSPKPSTSANPQRPTSKSLPKNVAGASTSPAPAASANGAPPAKRGFASILAKAQAAQEAAKAAGDTGGIKHKPVQKMSRREKARMEEQRAREAAGKGGKAGAAAGAKRDQSRDGTPNAPQQKKKFAEPLSYKGTMKKPVQREPLSYKGTMRKPDPAAPPKKKPQKDKYDGYVEWSDLDEAEDEEDGYESDGSSDMEGGFDDVEKEEQLALRTARKEDQEALEEEERLKREKMERKRKLQMLSKSAAGKKPRY